MSNWTEKDYLDWKARQRVKPLQPPCHAEAATGSKNKPLPPPCDEKALRVKFGPKQTKCEIEYGRMLAMEFPGAVVIPWGVTLRMQNGHKYTPDFAVLLPKVILLVEVKQRGRNGFRQPSYQRAKLAYDQCRAEFYQFQFRWAEKHCGIWTV